MFQVRVPQYINVLLNVFQTHLVQNTHFLKTLVSNFSWGIDKFCSSAHLNFRLAHSKMWFYTNILLLQDFSPTHPLWQSFALPLRDCQHNRTCKRWKYYIQRLQVSVSYSLTKIIVRFGLHKIIVWFNCMIHCLVDRMLIEINYFRSDLKNMLLQMIIF